MKIRVLLWLALAFVVPVLPVHAEEISVDKASIAEQIAAVQAQKDKAVARVKAIVNQPVTQMPTNSWAMVKIFTPGWFHDGAKEPDYDKVDVRATQEFPYAGYAHVSSNLNPNEMFNGPELEFNAMTKFFYTDHTLPKKRLTQAEMVEINNLYRVIGACNKRIAELNDAPETLLRTKFFFNSTAGTVTLLVLLSALFLLLYRKLYPSRR